MEIFIYTLFYIDYLLSAVESFSALLLYNILIWLVELSMKNNTVFPYLTEGLHPDNISQG